MKPEPATEDRSSGLPWPRSWSGVYWLVLAVFVLWVGLLTWLGSAYA